MDRVVIIGAGQAGVQAADSLRGGGYGGEITLVGAETAAPYQRPPLSKDYLLPDHVAEPLGLRGPSFYDQHRIDLRCGVTATAVDAASHAVSLSSGETLPYGSLVLATGAANRRLPVDGADLEGVHDLRTLDDAERLARALAGARRAVVVGAGFIGLEFAAAARRHGVAVTVLEAGERAMGRALSPVMSRHCEAAHRAMGSDVRLGEGLVGFSGVAGHVSAATSNAGAEYPCDLVVLAVGVKPRVELAETAGLLVDDGIVVDEHLRTTAPDI
jgi:3-phenylpropionate/trans-cinnamate dioxygenase ferredoxin reductase component